MIEVEHSNVRVDTSINLQSNPFEDFSDQFYQVGTQVIAKRLGEHWTKAEILHFRESENGYEYFVHYDGYNRRLDEWVPASRVKLSVVRAKKVFEKNSNNESFEMPERELTNEETIESFQNCQENSCSDGEEEEEDEIQCGDESSPECDEFHTSVSSSTLTRNKKRKYDEINHVPMSLSDMDPITAALEKEYAEKTKIKYIDRVTFGEYVIDTWYFSPYPEEYGTCSALYVCQFCMKYMRFLQTYTNHVKKCNFAGPPGKMIYNDGNLVVFEVDGGDNKLYCQNLCLLAKMFLDHKTLYFDVAPFMFYVLTESRKDGYHLLGFFSKEKVSLSGNNLSCILVLPPYQRCGYGKFLISLSYEISKREHTVGGPEKPLSDLGKLTYRSYWCWVLLNYLRNNIYGSHTIADLSYATGIDPFDITSTLQALSLMKYWKGQHVVCFSPKVIDQYLSSGKCRPPKIVVNPQFLEWTPPSVPSSKPSSSHLEPLSSVSSLVPHDDIEETTSSSLVDNQPSQFAIS